MSLQPRITWPQGQLVKLQHTSKLLPDNAYWPEHQLQHEVYLPPGYDKSGQSYPVLVCLAAYTNAGPGMLAWRNHGETVAQRLDRLQHQGQIGPCIVVFPNAYNPLGGNQYVNSSTLGQWADIISDEILPLVDRKFRTCGERCRAVFGKSSGGFGAMHLALTQPGRWRAIASHAGDCGFELVCKTEFADACQVFERYDYDLEKFIKQFWRRKKTDYREFHALMILCLAASYDPQPDQPLGLRLPFSPLTCELLDVAWQNWLKFDPAQQSDQQLQAFEKLDGFWLDVGKYDQYQIQFGTRRLHQRLDELQIQHQFEEFEGNHSGIDWRLDHSLPFLYQSLVPEFEPTVDNPC